MINKFTVFLQGNVYCAILSSTLLVVVLVSCKW